MSGRRAMVDLQQVAGRVGEEDGVVAGRVGHRLRPADVARARLRGDGGETVDLRRAPGPKRDPALARPVARRLGDREVGGARQLQLRRPRLPHRPVEPAGEPELRQERLVERQRRIHRRDAQVDVAEGVPRRAGHSGMLPCFRSGRSTRFRRDASSAVISAGRVRDGAITSSTYPRSAAVNGFANRSRYSSTSSARRVSGSSAASSSLRKTMLTAPSGPITATSAVGQAKLKSAPTCLELMTSYAPPYALRVITASFGTDASQ